MTMILSIEELQKVTSSDHVYKNSFGLTLSKVEELIGTPTIEQGEVKNTKTEPVEMYQDLWQLSSDTYYVTFNESVSLVTDRSAILLPHVNIMRAGGIIVPRVVERSGQVRTVMRTNNRVKISPDTPIATMVVFNNE